MAALDSRRTGLNPMEFLWKWVLNEIERKKNSIGGITWWRTKRRLRSRVQLINWQRQSNWSLPHLDAKASTAHRLLPPSVRPLQAELCCVSHSSAHLSVLCITVWIVSAMLDCMNSVYWTHCRSNRNVRKVLIELLEHQKNTSGKTVFFCIAETCSPFVLLYDVRRSWHTKHKRFRRYLENVFCSSRTVWRIANFWWSALWNRRRFQKL